MTVRARIFCDRVRCFFDHLLPEAGGLLFCGGRDGHFEAAVVNRLEAKRLLEHFEVDGDLVLRREFLRRVGHGGVRIGLGIENPEAGLRVADALARAAERRDGGAALVAVEVDDEVEVPRPQAADETDERAKRFFATMLVDGQAFVDAGIFADQVSEREVGQKRNFRVRKIRAQRPQRRRDEEEVADVHRVDDEDGLVGHKIIFPLRSSSSRASPATTRASVPWASIVSFLRVPCRGRTGH